MQQSKIGVPSLVLSWTAVLSAVTRIQVPSISSLCYPQSSPLNFRQKTRKEKGAWPAGGFTGWALEWSTPLLLTSLTTVQSHALSNFREDWGYSWAACLGGGREFWWLRGSLHHTTAVSLQSLGDIVAMPAVWNREPGAYFVAEEANDTGNHRWIKRLWCTTTWTNCYDSTDVI